VEQAKEFFTLQALASIGGASLAVLVVTNAAYKLFGLNRMAVSFLASVLIVFAAAYESGALSGIGGVVLAVVNSCLLFSTATGMQEVTAGAVQPREVARAKPFGAKERKVLESWVK